MPQASKAERPPLCRAGEHLLKLLSVQEVELDDFQGTGKTVRWRWTFRSNQQDEDGNPFAYKQYTGATYGNERAGLTKLLDMLMPDSSENEKATVDTDDLVGRRWKCRIKHGTTEKGEPKAMLVLATAYEKGDKGNGGDTPAKPKRKDPFADDDDEDDEA